MSQALWETVVYRWVNACELTVVMRTKAGKQVIATAIQTALRAETEDPRSPGRAPEGRAEHKHLYPS